MGVSVEKCLQAWTNSLKQINVNVDIVFFGDSLTFFGEFSSVLPNKTIFNLGLRGDTLQGMIDRVEQVKLLQPKVVYLMGGINDVTTLSSSEFKNMYSLLTQTILCELPRTELCLQSILPVNSSDFLISCDNNQVANCNHIIREIAGCHNLRYLDLFEHYIEHGQLPISETSDGLHLRPNAYMKWYTIIKSDYEENEVAGDSICES